MAVVIPAYKPSPGLIDLVRALSEQFAPAIVIVDDGSGPDFREVFAAVAAFPNVQLLRHAVNLGKGSALKTAINHVLCSFPNLVGIVTADADGQHHPEDIQRVGEALMAQPQSLILGSRSFDRDVPLRSRFGNIATRGIMHALLGQKLTDTQTGLRGIPAGFLPNLLRHEATGYEFELEMLIAAHERSIPIVEVPIRTIYEPGNKSSHFNPIVDSMKIYFVLLRFGSVSLLSGVLDSLIYILVWNRTQSAVASQVIGRLVSVCFNYSMVRRSVFFSREGHKKVLPKYLLLVLASGTASYAGIHFMHQRLGVRPIPAKLLVETILFFVNFAVQRLFIFKPQNGEDGEPRAAQILAFSTLVALAFAALLGVEIYGLATTHLFGQEIWYPVGLKRFIRFGGTYLALAVPLLAMVPWTFATFIAALLIVLSSVAVGPQAVLAVAFFLISSNALGSRILGRHKTPTPAIHLCATLLGIGVFVFLMTFLVRLPVNYPAVWAGLLAVPILLDLRGVWRRLVSWTSALRRIELRGGWERPAFALLLFLLMAEWLVVLKPEIGADGLAMHLATPVNIAANHQMTYRPENFLWSLMPMGCDWAYSIVYLLGGEFASRLLNFAMLLIAVALLYTAVRHWVSRATALMLAASFAATPLVQVVTGSLFVENFLAALVLGLFTVFCLYSETGSPRFLFAAALLCGTALTAKYGALLFVVLLLPFLVAEVVRHWKLLGARPLATTALAFVLLVATAAPTYAIAYRKTGNPIYPFLNRKFPSPLLDAGAEFIDARFHIPVDWATLHSLTFHTSRSFEGQNGSFGFQYLLMVPLALLGLLVAARRPSLCAAVLALGGGAGILLSTPNVRYLYASMALLPIPFAALLAWLNTYQRWMYRTLIVYLFVCTALNAYFLPASSYYHKDFCLRLPFSRAERAAYIHDAAPVREIVDWYNAHHPDSAVLLTADSTIAGLNGKVYLNHWHQYPTMAALQRVLGLPEALQLMKEWGVQYFIARKPTPGDEARPAVLAALLEKCTQPEFQAGNMYLARLSPDCRPEPQHQMLVTRGFFDDFDPAILFRGDWSKDTSFEGPDRHTISYSDIPGAETSIAFQGTILTYVFTKAPNRGIAAVTVDGADQGSIDLYSANIEWQTRKKLCCFGPGRHLAVIKVSGQANPKSTGRFVDLDSFEVW